MLEFATSAAPFDADEWSDPEVVRFCGIDAAELARYRHPPEIASQGGGVPQPNSHAKPNFVFPPEMRERGEALLRMSDDEIAALLSVPTPPVPKQRATATG